LKKIRPRIATQRGRVAMSRAAMPEATVVSPSVTSPFPPRSRKPPMIAASRHSRRPGRGSPGRPRAVARYRMTPAIRNRIEPIAKGGIVSTATRMARYVEPQTR
jgi:hypothetical protein